MDGNFGFGYYPGFRFKVRLQHERLYYLLNLPSHQVLQGAHDFVINIGISQETDERPNGERCDRSPAEQPWLKGLQH